MLQLTRRYLRQIDGIFLALCAACSVLSVVTLVSIGHNQLGSINKASVQFIASALGILLALIVSTVDYRALARAWPLHAVLAWGMVLPTLLLHNVRLGFLTVGYDAGGTSNYSWYRVGGMTFQPAELAKISFVLTLALHLNHVRGRVNKPANLLALAVHVLLPVLAIHIQGDDGTALVFLGIGLVMVFAGGISGWLVAGGLAAAGGGAALLLKLRPGLLKGYQAKRIFAVLDPENPALADIAYQQNKGAMAIGTGGLTGTGLWGEHVFVPNSWNDFVFSYLANAMGFVGGGNGSAAVAGHLGAHSAGSAAKHGCFGPLSVRGHLCRTVLAVHHQPGHEFTGAAGHRGHAAVLLGRRVQRGHGVFVRGAGAGGIPQEPPQKAGGAH